MAEDEEMTHEIKNTEPVTYQPSHRISVGRFVPDVTIDLPISPKTAEKRRQTEAGPQAGDEKFVSDAINEMAGPLSRGIDPDPILMYFVTAANPTLLGLQKAISAIERPEEFQDLDLTNPDDAAKNATFAIASIRAAANSTTNPIAKKELKAIDEIITSESGALIIKMSSESFKKHSDLLDKALSKLPVKVLSTVAIGAFLAGCTGTVVTPRTPEPGATSTQTSEVATVPATATTEVPTSTATQPATATATKTETATEAPQLVVFPNSAESGQVTNIDSSELTSDKLTSFAQQIIAKAVPGSGYRPCSSGGISPNPDMKSSSIDFLFAPRGTPTPELGAILNSKNPDGSETIVFGVVCGVINDATSSKLAVVWLAFPPDMPDRDKILIELYGYLFGTSTKGHWAGVDVYISDPPASLYPFSEKMYQNLSPMAVQALRQVAQNNIGKPGYLNPNEAASLLNSSLQVAEYGGLN